jgi:flavin-dependent dehydrogenase
VSDGADLIVVGGGPAGLATAIEARCSGLEVIVVDRRRPPVDVACGEGLMPGGVARLAGLGIDPECLSSHPFRGIRYLDAGRTAEGRFRRGSGLGIRRPILHAELDRRAVELGVDLRWGVSARGYDGRDVDTDRGPLRGTWVVAADGRTSQMRRWAGIAVSSPTRQRFGLRRHYAVAPWTDLVEVYWADDAEAYVTPVGPETVGVAVLSEERPLSFDRMLGRFPGLADRLAGAEVVSSDRGAGPFGQRPATVVRGRVVLLGDASGCLDPITGEGLSVAFGQAAAVVRAIRRGAIGGYAAAHRRLVRPPRLLTAALLAAERRPPLRRAVIRLLAANPRLFSRLVDRVGRAGT